VVQVSAGVDHCDSDELRFLVLLRNGEHPPEAVASFLRDPQGVMRTTRPEWGDVEPLATQQTVPDSARDSGFRKDGARLFLPDDLSAAFIVLDGEVERWPASPHYPGCD
jgi:hypothetical protein